MDADDPQSKLLTHSFLNGYRTKMVLDNEVVAQFPQFQRYANLYKYARLLEALDYGEINDTPTWFDDLKEKLISVADKLRNKF